ncbi:MAG: 16S rRNA (cytidine1402-2'-O)-methyltransferase [Saprospiraceae bacterium]|jgi:16S rRNA (cytidine1402-2'-O)-methyltransferase|tara:strand:+ start:2194 stop:3039 length:846 start_codon:yes stop_codon:yes gene_type:complete
MTGELYVVATPIGNMDDMSPRAVDVLKAVDLVAAEDTRHSSRLFSHFGIKTPMVSYHDHSDNKQIHTILDMLLCGKSVALISDAGTPLISDPGYRLVKTIRKKGLKIVPIPGSCALIAAISASGLSSDRFIFEGFLPAKSAGRISKLKSVAEERRTLMFYEAPHRILETLTDMIGVFGEGRQVVIARELTKTYETFLSGPLADVLLQVKADDNQQKGEIVLVVEGSSLPEKDPDDVEAKRILSILLEDVSLKQAASLAAKITGVQKNLLYKLALSLKEQVG